jgi:hypothetical protein
MKRAENDYEKAIEWTFVNFETTLQKQEKIVTFCLKQKGNNLRNTDSNFDFKA